MPAPTAQQLIEAGTDVDTLGKVINAPADFGATARSSRAVAAR